MPTREELIAQAKAKWAREQLVAQARAKWESENAKSSEDAEPKTTASEAALESFGNAATLGYLPQLQAAAEPVMNRILDKITGNNVAGEDQSTYLQRRDENISRHELQKKEHPYAAGAGMVAGTAASVVGTGGLGAVAKGASAAQRLSAASKAGAVLGGVSNPGDVKGEGDAFQMEERLKNAGIGAVLGAGGQLVAEGAGIAASKAREVLRDYAAKKAFRATGREAVKKSEVLAKSGRDIEIGREMLDAGTVPVLGSTTRIAKRVAAAKEKADDVISKILESTGKGESVFDSEAVAIKLLDMPELKTMRTTPGMEGVVRTIEDAAETLSKNGKLTLEGANKLKRAIDKSINYNKKIPEMAGKQEGLFKTRTAVRDEMNELVNQMSPGKAKDQLLAANRKSGNLATAEEILEKELGREQRNRMFGLTDTIAAAGGLAIGDDPTEKAVYAAAIGLLNKGGRKFGNSIQARGADGLAKQLAKIPRLAQMAEKNPSGFAAAIERVTSKLTAAPVPHPQFAGSEGSRGPADASQLKGYARWENEGAKKLGISDQEKAELMKSKEGRRALSEASDLAPGSPALERIKTQLQKGGSKK